MYLSFDMKQENVKNLINYTVPLRLFCVVGRELPMREEAVQSLVGPMKASNNHVHPNINNDNQIFM